MNLRRANPAEPQATQLLQASHALMQSLFPAEANHYLDVNALQAPNISFFLAEEDGIALGCCALANKGTYGEVKSMFVDPQARGKGVGSVLLQGVQDHARSLTLPSLRLETGTGLDAAHRLYRSFGFIQTGRFGDYVDSPYSLFFEKPLAADPS